MSLPCRSFAALVLGLLFFVQTALAATDKNPKPADLVFQPTRVAFDCAGRDTLTLYPGFLAEIPDSTTASANNLTTYSCRSWNEMGPENIYRLEVTGDLDLFAALRNYSDPTAPPDEDLDIFLLGDCDTEACLAGENLEFSLSLSPGTYYLVVDGYGTSNPAQGLFTLVVECREQGVPVAICAPDGADAVNPGTGTVAREGNLFGQPNLVQTYDCSPIVERGGELWYAVTVEAQHEFTAATTGLGENLDAALWLFDTCGPTAQCLGFADDKLAGEAETLSWANDTNLPVTVFLGLDCYRAPVDENAGGVSIQFAGQSNVPTVKRSWGSVRSVYR